MTAKGTLSGDVNGTVLNRAFPSHIVTELVTELATRLIRILHIGPVHADRIQVLFKSTSIHS